MAAYQMPWFFPGLKKSETLSRFSPISRSAGNCELRSWTHHRLVGCPPPGHWFSIPRQSITSTSQAAGPTWVTGKVDRLSATFLGVIRTCKCSFKWTQSSMLGERRSPVWSLMLLAWPVTSLVSDAPSLASHHRPQINGQRLFWFK